MNSEAQSQAIVSIIAAQSVLARQVNIYDYEISKPDGYPTITVSLSQNQGIFADTTRNQRSYTWSIRVLQERLNFGEKKAEQVVRKMADELMTIFDAQGSLGLNNTCNFAKPISIRGYYTGSPEVDVRAIEILLEAVVLQ